LVPKSVVRVITGRYANFSSLEDKILGTAKLIVSEATSQGT